MPTEDFLDRGPFQPLMNGLRSEVKLRYHGSNSAEVLRLRLMKVRLFLAKFHREHFRATNLHRLVLGRSCV